MKLHYSWKEMPPIARIITIGSTLILLIAVGVFIGFGMLETKVSVTDRQIRISGFYGQTIQFEEINNISLIDKTLDQIGSFRRVNGFGGLGQTLLGNFQTGGERVRLFVKYKTPPIIYIECNDRMDVYVNFYDSGKTVALYEEIISAMSR